MIELLGLFYGITKDIKDYLTFDEEAKVVDSEWLDKSGFGKLMEDEGYKLRWTISDKVETRKLDEYEIIYEVDKLKRVRRSIERRGRSDALILMGKKVDT